MNNNLIPMIIEKAKTMGWLHVFFINNPVSVIVASGTNTTFSVEATSSTAMVYQWQEKTSGGNWTNLANVGVYSEINFRYHFFCYRIFFKSTIFFRTIVYIKDGYGKS